MALIYYLITSSAVMFTVAMVISFFGLAVSGTWAVAKRGRQTRDNIWRPYSFIYIDMNSENSTCAILMPVFIEKQPDL